MLKRLRDWWNRPCREEMERRIERGTALAIRLNRDLQEVCGDRDKLKGEVARLDRLLGEKVAVAKRLNSELKETRADVQRVMGTVEIRANQLANGRVVAMEKQAATEAEWAARCIAECMTEADALKLQSRKDGAEISRLKARVVDLESANKGLCQRLADAKEHRELYGY